MDWDSLKAMEMGLMSWRLVQEYGWWEGWKIEWYPSRTRGHRHAIVTATEPLTDMERILIACLLYSDLQHERLDYCRVLAKTPWPILFIDLES